MKPRTYNYKIKKPSPLWRKQEVLSIISENSGKVVIRQVVSWVGISIANAESIAKELANAGYVQIGKQHKCILRKLYGSKNLWITPGSDVNGFLNLDIKVCIEEA